MVQHPELTAAMDDLLPDLSAELRLSPRQEEVLRSLEHLILEEGFEHLTVGTLAHRLQCSRRTLYEIAESKDEFVLLAIDRIMRRLGRRAHAAIRNETRDINRLKAFLLTGLVELRDATAAFVDDVEHHGAARRLVNSHYRYATAVIARLVDSGIKSGAFRPVHAYVLAEALVAGIVRLQDPDVLRRTSATLADAMEEYMSVLIDGLSLDTVQHSASRTSNRQRSQVRFDDPK
jgi:AcrR family transcriptional regulator